MVSNELKLGEQLNILFFEKTGKKYDVYFSAYRPKLIWFLTKYLNGDAVLAEEITDEAFVKAFYEIAKYNGEKSKFPTWLFTIARNIATQTKKTNSRFESVEEDHDGATIGDFLYSEDNSANEERERILAKKVQLVKNEISNLPEKYSLVLMMREIDNMAYQEIADYLDLNLNTVKSQIKQGRELLVKKLEPKFKILDEMGV